MAYTTDGWESTRKTEAFAVRSAALGPVLTTLNTQSYKVIATVVCMCFAVQKSWDSELQIIYDLFLLYHLIYISYFLGKTKCIQNLSKH